jgi:hypothetical protein
MTHLTTSQNWVEAIDSIAPYQGHIVSPYLTIDQFRYFCSYPVWNMATQFIKHTRSYKEGLEVAELLLRAAHTYRDELHNKEVSRSIPLILYFTLTMLDKLDRWEDYLSLFDLLRSSTDFYSVYAEDSVTLHPACFLNYKVGEEGLGLRIHFLYNQNHRREIIQRKLKRKKEGKSIGHLLHARQDELASADIRYRIEWLIGWYRSMQETAAHYRNRNV